MLAPQMSAIRRPHERPVPSPTASWSAFLLRWPLPAVVAGYALLLVAVTNVLFFPNGWPPVLLAGGAAVLLAFDRKLGPLPAALFVMLAMPVGRGSEVGLPRVLGDVPVRPHDLVPLLGVGLSLPAVLRRLSRPRSIAWTAIVPLGVFVVVGVLAGAVGVAGDQALRDVIRDARWWAFYAIGIVALLAGTRRPAILRALIWGMTIYAAVLLIGLLMPMFHGGLKYGAYAYDPRLRLHYGQAIFLLPAVAIVGASFVRRPQIDHAALLALLAAAVGVTLTRTLLSGVLGVAVLVAAWITWQALRRGGRDALRTMAPRAALAVLAVAIGIGVGLGAYQFGITIWTPDWAYGPAEPIRGAPTADRPTRPSIERIFEDTQNAGLEAQGGGRLASYAIAIRDIADAPLLGHGLGQQAEIPWAWGGFRARAPGSQPGVDNAYLTVGLKAGTVGIAAFTAMILWPLRQLWAPGRRRMSGWFVPAWLALLGLMLLQSYAVSGYAPAALALLTVLPGIRPGTRSVSDV